MKLKLIDGEPVCHRECEHFKEPQWCGFNGRPYRNVHWQYSPPCIPGVRQQRDEARARVKELTETPMRRLAGDER